MAEAEKVWEATNTDTPKYSFTVWVLIKQRAIFAVCRLLLKDAATECSASFQLNITGRSGRDL